MPQEPITVHFTIDLTGSGDKSIVFSRWFPVGKAEGLSFQYENFTGVLWFELDSTFSGQKQDHIAQTINIMAEKLYGEIATTVDGELAEWIKHRDCRHAPPPDETVLSDAYRRLGVDVSAALDHGLSRFLSFVRIEKGQYGVAIRAFGSYAKARTSSGDWFRWCPTNVITVNATFPNENDPRMLRAADWELAQAFMASDSRPTLTLELLAGAEALQASGSNRAALTEAVSALEVALYEFAASAVQPHDSIPESVKQRVGVTSLKQLVEHLGLSTSVAYLLPFLFSEDQLPAEVLAKCREAIQRRQNVVHNGQRTLSRSSLIEFLTAIRRLCELLLKHSRAEAEKPGQTSQ